MSNELPDRETLLAGLRREIADLSDAPLDSAIRAETSEILEGVCELLTGLADRDGMLTPGALQEVVRAYLVGRRDAIGLMGGTVRRQVWPRLARSGITLE